MEHEEEKEIEDNNNDDESEEYPEIDEEIDLLPCSRSVERNGSSNSSSATPREQS